MRKKVLSYSLYGTKDFYWGFLPALVRGVHNLFPGWELRIHHDSGIDRPIGAYLKLLHEKGLVNAVYVEESKALCRSMLWRMMPIWDEEVDIVMCRDCDAIPTISERRMIDKFVETGATCHVINDNPAHTVPIMGGLCGWNAPKFREKTGLTSWDQLVSMVQPHVLNSHGGDQHLLAHHVWPILRNEACEHRLSGFDTNPNAIYSTKEVDPTPTPDVTQELQTRADGLCAHLGSAGYDKEKAIEMLDTYGKPELAEMFKELDSVAKKAAEKKPTKYVVLSCTANPEYDFFLPLTGKLWKDRGYTPLVLLIGDRDYWVNSVPGKYLDRIGAELVFVEVDGVPDHAVAQVARLYCACLGLDDGDYAITSDVDMWPVAKDFWNVNSGMSLDVWGINREFEPENTRPPVCYVGGPASSWRKLMQIPNHNYLRSIGHTWRKDANADVLRSVLNELFQTEKWKNEAGDVVWEFDEMLLKRRLEAMEDYPNHCNIDNRRCPEVGHVENRLDRVEWTWDNTSGEAQLEGVVDAHLPRPGLNHWDVSLKRLFEVLDPENDWVHHYVEDYRNAQNA